MLRLHGVPFDDERYPALAEQCHDLIWDVSRQVLRAGTDVVLDWNHWSRERRARSRDRAREAGCTPVLHYVPVALETAIARAGARTREGAQHVHHLDAAAIRHVASIFEAPTSEEGMELCIVAD